MIGRIVDIAEDDRHLSVYRGFLKVESGGEEITRIALDDLMAIICHAHGVTYSNNLLVELAKRNIVLVVCGANHAPAAILWPVDTHHIQAARMRAQIAAPKPLQKQLWRQIVQAKIRNQGTVIAQIGKQAGPFDLLARSVKSGDSTNVEAQAARRYWPLLFGKSFRRDKNGDGINGMLNYGYAILRSATARAVMGAGLHPTLGIHHHNRQNPMCLVDDLMEVFRPLVDRIVLYLIESGHDSVTPEVKRILARLVLMDLQTDQGTTPLMTAIGRLATSVALAFEKGKGIVDVPRPPLPLDFAKVMTDA